MKTKSYTIHTEHGKLQIDETPKQTGIIVKIITGQGNTITLNHKEWNELCGMKYDLECHEAGLPNQASDIKLTLPTDQLKQQMEVSDD